MAVDDELPVDTLGAFVAPPAVLVRGADTGPLAGTTLVVKDVIDVAGVVTGAGVPEFAAALAPAAESAAVVEHARRHGRDGDRHDGHRPARLLAPWYDDAERTACQPPRRSAASPEAPRQGRPPRSPAGSPTSGSAPTPEVRFASRRATAASSAGGPPTGGSTHAASCTSHARSTRSGSSPTTCRPIARGRLPARRRHRALASRRRRGSTELSEHARPDAHASLVAAVTIAIAAPTTTLGLDLTAAANTFHAIQGHEAWREHGEFIESAHPALHPDIRGALPHGVAGDRCRGRRSARRPRRGRARRARHDRQRHRAARPPTPSGAPAVGAPDTTRARALELTCLGGLSGSPVVVLPLGHDGDLPLGLACLGAPGSDRALLRWCASLFPR